MQNYLGRVAAAGARTSTPIRPPVSAPPVMPGPGLFESEFPGWRSQPTDPPMEDAKFVQIPAAKPPEASHRLATEAPRSAPAAAPGEQPVDSSPGAVQPMPPREPVVESTTSRPGLDEIIRAPRSLRLAPETHMPGVEAVVRRKQDLPAVPSEQAATPSAGISRPQDTPAPGAPAQASHHPVAPETAARESGLLLQTPAATFPPSAAGILSMPSARQVSAIQQSAVQVVSPPSAARAGQTQPYPPDLAAALPPLPPAQPGPPEPPVVPTRQSRISIGRLDIQVNNQRPQPRPVQPAPSPPAPQPDILAAVYLDRFRLRL